jgi:hypothetical protein
VSKHADLIKGLRALAADLSSGKQVWIPAWILTASADAIEAIDAPEQSLQQIAEFGEAQNQVPLTDKQIDEMGQRWVRDGYDLLHFASSIEAAHGIKESK